MTSLNTLSASLPFNDTILITQDAVTAAAAIEAHPTLTEAAARNWDVGTAEWDLCTASVSTTWFMAISSHYRASQSFDLPASTDGYKPLIPYVILV